VVAVIWDIEDPAVPAGLAKPNSPPAAALTSPTIRTSRLAPYDRATFGWLLSGRVWP
jgi:hypothetical protein